MLCLALSIRGSMMIASSIGVRRSRGSMTMTSSVKIILLALLSMALSSLLASAVQVTYNAGNLLIDGAPRVIVSGSIHYPRSTTEMWPDLIQKSKEGGLNAIETYVFWDRHEPQRRQYDFSGNLDLVRFLKTIQDAGLYAILRIGPYVCAEWTYGGFPMWLHNLPGVQFRTDNQVYKDEMQSFITYIVDLMKKEKLFASQGGPIILSQIENEYGNIDGPYGDAGKNYIKWCAKLAESFNVGNPWIMCQQSDAPAPMINTCNGYYCHDFQPNNPRSPKMWTENWSGWFQKWGQASPHRTAEDLAYSVARFFQSGGILQNYYMYHGGTNFGRTAGGPYIATTYDYNAPLDEYSNLNQPKWGHLKKLHNIIIAAEKILTQKSSTENSVGSGVTLTEYKDKNGNGSICFLSNDDEAKDANVNLQEKGKFTVPAWSVSILQDCKQVIYNTAKVSTQTSLMEMRANGAEKEPQQLNWVWKAEPMKDALKGIGASKATKLIDQKTTTVDASDYLWYMTGVDFGLQKGHKGQQMTLRVNTTGHGLHVFVNKRYIGSQFGTADKLGFVYEQPITVRPGANHISLLSATVGYPNYGAYFELQPAGIVGGPVVLAANGSTNVTKDLSANSWTYKVGINGELRKFYNPQASLKGKWKSEALPVKKPMTWYKTTFKAPLGTDPVVVDLLGLGKGHAWVNGHSIGRFWPVMNAQVDGCTDTCDYRGQYKAEKCLTNCGGPSQRWYHVPRSFLLDDEDNTLVLFEELGGSPLDVNFQTVTVGKACGNTEAGSTLELSCQGGRTISAIEFASYGDAKGSCGSFKKGTCDADNTLSVLRKACVGKETCSVTVSEEMFGKSNCGANVSKRLAVQAVC